VRGTSGGLRAPSGEAREGTAPAGTRRPARRIRRVSGARSPRVKKRALQTSIRYMRRPERPVPSPGYSCAASP